MSPTKWKSVAVLLLAVSFAILLAITADVTLDVASAIVVLVVAWLCVEAVTALKRAFATSTKKGLLLLGGYTVGALLLGVLTLMMARSRSYKNVSQSREVSVPTSVDSVPPSTKSPHPPSKLSAARSFLVRGAEEEQGYGLYSYVIFRTRPTLESRPRYVAMIRAIIDRVERTDEMIAVGYPRDLLNVIYFPVVRRPTRSATPSEVAEWIIDHYDFARAAFIADRIEAYGDGPFLAASLRPVSDRSRPLAAAFVLNLRRSTTETAPLWARHFVAVSCEPQRWTEASLERAMLQVRDGLGTIATAGKPVIDAADVIIAWIKPRKLP